VKPKAQFNTERLRAWISSPRTQASLFDYVRNRAEPGILPELWLMLCHPIRSYSEGRHAPRTRASLFHYLESPREASPLDWRGLLNDLFTGYRFALFIPSLWADPAELAEQRAESRMRRMETGFASLAIHAAILTVAVFFAVHTQAGQDMPGKDPIVFLSMPMNLPVLEEGPEGGGGGGGGKREKSPPSGGRLPETAPVQLMAPDPGLPKPLTPPEGALDLKPSVQIPIDLPVDITLPIGDISSPLSDTPSSGPGTGGGIGEGNGPGIGPGIGPGAGPGARGGYGGGSDGGLGPGSGPHTGRGDVIPPEILAKPNPDYTEDARKSRTEGIVLLEVVIRANGSIDGIRIIKGLGHGLDESTILTVSTRWKFRPARYRGVPVDYPARIEVTFRLF